jgi:Tol biopolymer transport system component
MTLTPGARLGVYEVMAPLGAGGMGEVYRARDTRLDRDVALKVLPAEYAGEAERIRRLEHEARAASAQSHANVLAVYDVGTADGLFYVVSELLEGETLRDAMRSGITPERAVGYAVQIAHGLAAVHAKGVIHRDLKPDNLFLTRDGVVKILDFGLAKQRFAGADAADDQGTLSRGTAPGVLLGTVGYMSPEQARGQPADHRSDIFALGAVLYEMLARRRPFGGDTPAETLTAILRDDPPELSVPGSPIPSALDRIVRRCLEKRPDERFQSAHDVALTLEAVGGQPSHGGPAAAASVTRGRPALLVAGGLVAALAVLGVLGFRLSSSRPASAPEFKRLTFRRGIVGTARFAPDGQTILFTARWDGGPPRILVARRDGTETRTLLDEDATLADVSRDGRVALLRELRTELAGLMAVGTLATVDLLGGAPRDVAEGVNEAAWSPDGRLAVVRLNRKRLEFPIGHPLLVLPNEPPPAQYINALRFSPDGKSIAVNVNDFGRERGELVIVDVAGQARTLWTGGMLRSLAWSPDGREIWIAAGPRYVGITAIAAIDMKGRERVVLPNATSVELADLAADGTGLLVRSERRFSMVVRAPGEAEERDLSWLDGSIVADLSRDGRRVLFDEFNEGGGREGATYVRGTDGSPAVRLTAGLGEALSPDGRWVFWYPRLDGTRASLIPTGAGEPRPVDAARMIHYRRSIVRWSADGKELVLKAGPTPDALRLYAIDGALKGPARALTPPGMATDYFAVAPDGSAVAAGGDTGPPLTVYPIGHGTARRVPGAKPNEQAVYWANDDTLYVTNGGRFPLAIDALDLATGRRRPWRTLAPADPAGTEKVNEFAIAPEAGAHAYTFNRTLSDVYLVQGLR